MTVQFITDEQGRPAYAVVPIAEYRSLETRALDAADLRAALAAEQEESLPWAAAKRLIEGENPVMVWREHRGLAPAELARAAGVDEDTLSRIEGGRFDPPVRVCRSLADALGVTVDDLVT